MIRARTTKQSYAGQTRTEYRGETSKRTGGPTTATHKGAPRSSRVDSFRPNLIPVLDPPSTIIHRTISESLSKDSVPRASGDKCSDLLTLAGGTANPTTAVIPQPLSTSDDLPLTSAGEASQPRLALHLISSILPDVGSRTCISKPSSHNEL
ncbi:hypothetical protein PTTG_28912 [Puccinia triticina 1-1 BBBD Race 1]|uniref:Uncharacterized protein n=1 Tax=Puccinia triticina (isolate 1-1 / race 1 (BBBD)) TaxID=630390 RepID=A0A180G811_PUCT1|nr:hypothetical protein PTTG_28912 [Puccinia triticina 1-1 BBBD Race 1]